MQKDNIPDKSQDTPQPEEHEALTPEEAETYPRFIAMAFKETNKEEGTQPLPLGEDAYIQKCVGLANITNKLYHELEKLLEFESEKNTHLLDNLVEIEAYFDTLADKQQKRIAYIQKLTVS